MPYWNTIKRCTKVFAVVILLPVGLVAQNTGSSPYSRYALGDLSDGTSVFYTGLAGITTPFSFNSQVNYLNPAGNSTFRRNTALFDASFAGKTVEMQSSEGAATDGQLGLNGLALGLPLAERWGLVLAMKPYTNVGYKALAEEDIEGAGRTSFIYEGIGGLNTLFLSTGYSFLQRGDSIRLAAGIQGNFVFGAINHQRSTEFTNSNYTNVRVKNTLFVNDVTARGGVQFEAAYRKSRVSIDDKGVEKIVRKEFFRYGIGATYELGSSLSATRDEFVYTYTIRGLQAVINDTIAASFDEKGSISMPWKLTLGAFVCFNKDFTLAMQYDLEEWGLYKENFSSTSSLTSTNALSTLNGIKFGLMYRSFKKFDAAQRGNRIHFLAATSYMVGASRTSLPLNFNGTPVISDAVSFGFSIPLSPSRTLSSVNFGMELGKRGNVSDAPISERFASVRLGIIITPDMKYERWFYKYKYD